MLNVLIRSQLLCSSNAEMGGPLLLEADVVVSQCYAETSGCVETKDRVGLDGCTGYGVRLR